MYPKKFLPAVSIEQRRRPNAFKILLSVALVAAITGCSSQALTEPGAGYPRVYQQLSETYDNPAAKDTASDVQNDLRLKFQSFIEAHADLKSPDMADHIKEAYADDLYFNDTLKTLDSRDTLVAYLVETAERVDYNRVQIHEIIPSEDNYYVRWSMQTGFTLFNKPIETESIGMSHIRLNDEGKIYFHQDFWDNTEGFFQHLPVVGYLIGKTKQRL